MERGPGGGDGGAPPLLCFSTVGQEDDVTRGKGKGRGLGLWVVGGLRPASPRVFFFFFFLFLFFFHFFIFVEEEKEEKEGFFQGFKT